MTELHTNSDVIAAIRARKDELGLADEFFVEKVGMTGGSYSKYFGVIQEKVMSVHLLCNVMAFLGMELSVAVNPHYQPKDCNAWEPRDERKVHPNRRVSKAAMEMARPLIYREWFRNSQTRPGQRSFPGSTAAKSHAQRRFPDGDCIGLRSRPPPPRGRRHDHFVSDRRSV
jgi:hypothetical protein